MLPLAMGMKKYPSLNDKTLGWLTFLHRKVSINDDWSEDGEPLEWWDKTSNPPVLNFARFDLSESSYAIGLMADVTPAWREAYAYILKGLSLYCKSLLPTVGFEGKGPKRGAAE